MPLPLFDKQWGLEPRSVVIDKLNSLVTEVNTLESAGSLTAEDLDTIAEFNAVVADQDFTNASLITAGTFADAQISESSVLQHTGSITSLGTIATGTWNGDVLAHEYGGLEGDFSAGDGFVQIKGGATTVVKSNTAAAVAPGATDDSAAGYAVGSVWIDTTADKSYTCVDATATSAVWVEQGGGGLTQEEIDTIAELNSVVTDATLLTSGGNLGTPSAIVLTNASGTAASLTAGTVTTNANLTGHVTSTGNAAILGSFTTAQLNTAISDGTINTPEGTAVLSTGEVGGTKFLREDGDGTCSWQAAGGGSQTPWTSDIDADGYNLVDGGIIKLREQAAADADTAGAGQLWVKTAVPNQLWFTSDDGTDTQLGAGGGGLDQQGAGTFTSSGTGANVGGNATANSTIQGTYHGGLAHGDAYSYNGSYVGTIESTAQGAVAFGKARADGGASSSISASGDGAIAVGDAYGANLTSSSNGSGAFGHANTNAITANDTGAFAFGDSYGGVITAAASNSFQFAPGVNSIANSLQIGSEVNLREGSAFLKEKAAANADVAAWGQLWVKNTTPCQLWFTDDAGTDTQIV